MLVGDRFDLGVEAVVADGLILAEGESQIGYWGVVLRCPKEGAIGFQALAGRRREGQIQGVRGGGMALGSPRALAR